MPDETTDYLPDEKSNHQKSDDEQSNVNENDGGAVADTAEPERHPITRARAWAEPVVVLDAITLATPGLRP